MPVHSTTQADHRPPVADCSLHSAGGGLTNWRHPSGASIACGSIACGDGVETWEVWYAGDEGPTKWQTREQIEARLASRPDPDAVENVTLTVSLNQARTILAALSRRCDELESLGGSQADALLAETKAAYQSIDLQAFQGAAR